jgi:hypothetical protein
LEPVIGAKKLRTHGKDFVGDLEPAELGAHLPHPLAAILIDVVSLVAEDLSGSLRDVAALPLSNDRHHFLRRSESRGTEDIAHKLSPAVLNAPSNSISNVAHEIADAKVLTAAKGVVDVILVCLGQIA